MGSKQIKIGDTVLIDKWDVEVQTGNWGSNNYNIQARTLKNRSSNSNQIKQQLDEFCLDALKRTQPKYFTGYKELKSFFLKEGKQETEITPKNFNVGIVVGFWPDAEIDSQEATFVQILLNDAAYWISAEILKFLKVVNDEEK